MMGCFRCKKKKSRQVVDRLPSDLGTDRATVLPEPEVNGRSLQSAPSSFRIRVHSGQPQSRGTSCRTRVSSAPSMLAAAFDFGEEESSPLPLPCPSLQSKAVLRSMGSYKSSSMSNPSSPSTSLPLPPVGGALRNFSLEEISIACQHFSGDRCVSGGLTSIVYNANFGDDIGGSKKLEATVTRLRPSTQGLKEFLNEVNTIASLQHPHLCKLLGFHAQEGSDQRMLVYERLPHGSLDQLLYGRSDISLIDWSTRIKVAICAAQGLAFLHEEGPFQVMYNEFSTLNIQIDKDFTAKLSGYGCPSYNADTELSKTSSASANLPNETLERGLLTPKSNVWSFGVVLLELLTGRRNFDSHHQQDGNIIKWSRPFLADDSRLSLIMDPRLKGRFPLKAARTVADIALRCLRKETSERPTMRAIVETLKNVEVMRYSSRFPIQEPATVTGKQMLKSPSLSGIISPAPRLHFSPSPPPRLRPSRPPLPPVNLHFPPQAASTISLEDNKTSA